MGQSRIDVKNFLSTLPLFKELDSAGLCRLAVGANEFDTPRGSMVFRRNQTSNGLHIVVFGQVKLTLRSDNGDERIMGVVERGRTFGDAAMFLGKPYLADAETIIDSKILQVGRNVLLTEIHHNPGFAENVITHLSEQHYQQVENLEICILSSGVRRVIRYLLSHDSEKQFEGAMHVTLPTKKWIIASKLNLTQEHFSRILHALVRDDLIQMNGRQVCIPDAMRLRNFAAD